MGLCEEDASVGSSTAGAERSEAYLAIQLLRAGLPVETGACEAQESRTPRNFTTCFTTGVEKPGDFPCR